MTEMIVAFTFDNFYLLLVYLLVKHLMPDLSIFVILLLCTSAKDLNTSSTTASLFGSWVSTCSFSVCFQETIIIMAPYITSWLDSNKKIFERGAYSSPVFHSVMYFMSYIQESAAILTHCNVQSLHVCYNDFPCVCLYQFVSVYLFALLPAVCLGPGLQL